MSIRREGHWLTASTFIFPPFHLIIIFWSSSFKMYSCGREYIYTWIGGYVYTWIQLETLIPWWVAGLYRFAFFINILIKLRPTPWRMLLEFHLIDLAFMSAEHDVSARSLSRKVPTKRHPVAYKLSRWDASDSHLISLPLLHVHSSRRALAYSILLHFPSLPPYYNIMHFVFIGILSFLLLKCIHVDVNTYIHG